MSEALGEHGFWANALHGDPESHGIEHCRWKDFPQLLPGWEARDSHNYLECPPVDQRFCGEDQGPPLVSQRNVMASIKE
jgi:hypothetical protein